MVVITMENEKAVCRIKPKELIEFDGCTFADVLDNLAEVESESVILSCVSNVQQNLFSHTHS